MISAGPFTNLALRCSLVDKGRRLLVRAPASLARRFSGDGPNRKADGRRDNPDRMQGRRLTHPRFSFASYEDLDAYRRRIISKQARKGR